MYKETDLYEPIKKYFEKKGYRINAEVNGADIALDKDTQLIIVEIKKNLNITLLYQCIERQKIADFVYMAIPRPTYRQRKNFKLAQHIVCSLGIGLITVAMDSPTKLVEVVIDKENTSISHLRKNQKKRTQLIKEINGRNMNLNKGGSTKVKLNTAFREKCVCIACAMENYGEIDPKTLVKKHNLPNDTRRILYQNMYGWFDRVARGIYILNDKGRNALNSGEFEELVKFYRNF